MTGWLAFTYLPILLVKNHYLPGKGITGPLADQSAVRQSIVRLRVLPMLLVKLHQE
jgi:hypothetical protein